MTEDSVINSEPTCDLFAVYATARDVASAMAYIHSKDIIHGDLQGDALGLVSCSQDPRGFRVKASTTLASLPPLLPSKHTSPLQPALFPDPCLPHITSILS